jgi:hypothetical protein
MPVLLAIFEHSHELISRGFDHYGSPVSLASKPLSLINAAIRVYVGPNSMSLVIHDLPNVFVLAPPSAFNLGAGLE